MANTPKLFTREKANFYVHQLTAGEDGDGWTYRVKEDPKGGPWCLIEIYDETGAFVDYWGE